MRFSTFHLLHWRQGWSQQEVYDHELALLEYAEALGFHGAVVAEHHFRRYGICPNTLTFAAFAAARTSRLRIGTAIVVLPFHSPVRVAEEAAMVDLLSRGRLDFGFGRGYQGVEFAGWGLPLAEARERADEAIAIIRKAWTEPRLSYEGKFWRYEDIEVLPKPFQQPHPPIAVAAISPETVEHYAKQGIPLLVDPLATFNRLERAVQTFRATARASGYDPAGLPLAVMRNVHIAPTNAEAHDFLQRQGVADPELINPGSAPMDKDGNFAEGYEFWRDRYLKGNTQVPPDFYWDRINVAGDPDRVAEKIQILEAMGFDHILCSLSRRSTDELKEEMRLLAREVMPRFARSAVAAG
jgi:alkanesulfonate monooxygenase SsuD/methylene tetrahydromethanopterin reductase-like flavin-dependent oxidoreductase (luciferase family)